MEGGASNRSAEFGAQSAEWKGGRSLGLCDNLFEADFDFLCGTVLGRGVWVEKCGGAYVIII